MKFIPKKPIMVWDGDCEFCRKFAERFEASADSVVEFIPYQSLHKKYPKSPKLDYEKSVVFFTSTSVTIGAEAIFSFFNVIGKKWPKKLYENFSLVSKVSEFFYSCIAKNRRLFGFFSRILFGDNFMPDSYKISSWIFGRMLGLVGAAAFLSFWVQADLIIGSNGIVPFSENLTQIESFIIKSDLDTSKWLAKPTLLWLYNSDLWLNIVLLIGFISSLSLAIGLVPHVSILLSWASYLSIASVSEPFLNFQWDALLLEVYLISILFVPWRVFDNKINIESPPTIGRWLLWLLVIKLMLQSGIVKFTFFDVDGSNTWRDLTALEYHFWTQPIPSWLSYYFDALPTVIDKIALFFTYICELIIPFFILLPRKMRRIAAISLILFQFLIILSGNYGFFNLLTITLCISLFDDQYLRKLNFSSVVNGKPFPKNYIVYKKIKRGLSFLVLILFVFSFVVFIGKDLKGNRLSSSDLNEKVSVLEQKILGFSQTTRSINSYGLFRVMTKTRPEFKIELQYEDSLWVPIDFDYKPNYIKKKPAFFFPHMPRVDWQIWFEALYYEKLLSDPFLLSSYQNFLSTMVSKGLKLSNISIDEFLSVKAKKILKTLPPAERNSYLNRLSSSLNSYLGHSYWFAMFLSDLTDKKSSVFHNYRIKDNLDIIKMKVSLSLFTFNHNSKNSSNWWVIKNIEKSAFTIEIQ
ncbi:lipase maturation factor family protein [bacterium]|nr:lipase maturation factor family protein [bacterium]